MTNTKQAKAILLSEARSDGYDIPKVKKVSGGKMSRKRSPKMGGSK